MATLMFQAGQKKPKNVFRNQKNFKAGFIYKCFRNQMNGYFEFFRWDSLGVLGLVCRLYSERDETDRNENSNKKADLENKEDADKAMDKSDQSKSKLESLKELSNPGETCMIVEKAKQGLKEDICFLSDSSDIENDENEDEVTLFTFENEFLWDEV